MSKPIYMLDRSAAELDDKCGMALFWNRYYDGIGIVSAYENDALQTGKEIHDDLSEIAESDDPEKAADELATELLEVLPGDAKQSLKEHLFRRLGWLYAFALYIEPKIRSEWENVQIEGELILDRSPLWVPTTPDRLLKHKTLQGFYKYMEYKSTISASTKWLNSWKKAIQLHIGLKAAEEEIGHKINLAQIMALMKGDMRDGRLHHPYVWGYYNDSKDRWEHDYTRARGGDWKPRGVWDFPDGIKAWVQKLGESEAIAQFPVTPPIGLDERLLNQWVARKTARMKIVETVKDLCQTDEESRVLFFEPRTAQCEPAFGFSCPYNLACHNNAVHQNPVRSGEYVQRMPHHEVEILWRRRSE